MVDRYRPPPQLATIPKGRLPSTGRCENATSLRRHPTAATHTHKKTTQFRPNAVKVDAYIMKGSSSASFKKRNMLSGLTQLADASQLT